MLKKLGLLAILSIFSNAENIKIEKFNLNDIKKCLEPNNELLCKDNYGGFIYRDLFYFENDKTPICNEKLENINVFSARIHSIDSPKMETIKTDNKITTKQTYKTEIISSSKTGACKTDNLIIIKIENK